jgi:hypothetical protein
MEEAPDAEPDREYLLPVVAEITIRLAMEPDDFIETV